MSVKSYRRRRTIEHAVERIFSPRGIAALAVVGGLATGYALTYDDNKGYEGFELQSCVDDESHAVPNDADDHAFYELAEWNGRGSRLTRDFSAAHEGDGDSLVPFFSPPDHVTDAAEVACVTDNQQLLFTKAGSLVCADFGQWAGDRLDKIDRANVLEEYDEGILYFNNAAGICAPIELQSTEELIGYR